MKLKILIYGSIFMFFTLSCSNSVIDPSQSTENQLQSSKLKAATIGTYFVSPAGSDKNPGTESQPFLTAAYAAKLAKAGDIVIFEDGIYTGTPGKFLATLSHSGTSSAYITFKARNKGGAILDGQNNTAKAAFSIIGSYINISGFEIKGMLGEGIEARNGASYLNFSDLHIHDIGRGYFETGDGKTAFTLGTGSYIIVERCLMHDIGAYASGGTEYSYSANWIGYQTLDHGIYIAGTSHLTIKNNVFYNCKSGFGIQFYSGAGDRSSYVDIINNTFENGNPWQNGGHITLCNTISNILIANNIFKDQHSYAIAVLNYGYTYTNVTVTKNITSGGNGHIITGSTSGLSVTGNYDLTDPLFTNEETHDYSLKSNSPAAIEGYNTGITTDYLNNARKTINIGAYASYSAAPAQKVVGTYYVSPTGSDSNPGSESQPFLTATYAVSSAKPGDIVIFEDGIYTASSGGIFARLSRSGSSSSYITFKSRNKWGAVLDGRSNETLGGISVSGSYINIEGFELKGFSEFGFVVRPGASHVNIRDVYVHDIGRMCTDTDQTIGAVFIDEGSYITIERCLIHDIGRYGPGEKGCSPANQLYKNLDHGTCIDGSSNVTIKNNIFYNLNHGFALHVYSGKGLPSSNIKFIHNTCENGNPYQVAGHIILWGSFNNSLIANNIFKDQHSSAIQIYQGSYTYSDVTITNNITSGGNGNIITGSAKGVTVSNNYNSTDPLFTNEWTHDYSLQSNSPAINAGYDTGIYTNFFNNARNTINIGAL